MASNFMIGWGNRLDELTALDISSTFSSSGTWSSIFPLSNLLNPNIRAYAKTTATDDLTLTFDMASYPARNVGVVGICGHNLSKDASIQITVYQDLDPTIASDTFSLWPYLPPEHSYWKPRIYSLEVVDASRIKTMMPVFMWTFENSVIGNKVIIEIKDPTNADGYFRIGRVFIGELFKPTRNAEYGDVNITYVDYSNILTSAVKTRNIYSNKPLRNAQIAWKNLNKFQAIDDLFEIQRVTGLTKELVFTQGFASYSNIDVRKVPDSRWFASTFLGYAEELTSLTYNNFDRFGNGFKIIEAAQ